MTYSQEQYDALLAVCRSYKQEIEQLTRECNQHKVAVKEFAEKVKDYLEYKLVDEFGDMAVDVQYLTIDVDEFEDYVDELLKEYEK